LQTLLLPGQGVLDIQKLKQAGFKKLSTCLRIDPYIYQALAF